MKTKIWIPILFLALLAGCRSTKDTLKTKVEQMTNTEVKKNTSVDSTVNSIDHSTAVIKTDEVINIAEFSKPDSVGRQYKIKVTTIIRKQNTAVSNDQKKESHIKANSDYKSDIKQKTAVKQAANHEQATKPPVWVFILIFILLGAALWYFIK